MHHGNRNLVDALCRPPGGSPETPARCQKLGAASQLSKPVARSELLAAIQRALGTPEARGNIQLITSSSLRPARTGMRILLAEDNAVNQRVAVHMLEKTGIR
jgi:two-component system, sensor histidine kinase and response regulator